MKQLKYLFFLLAFVCSLPVVSQFNYREEGKPDTNFFQIQNRYLEGYAGTGQDTSEGSEFSQFLRWRNFWLLRLSPTGSFQVAAKAVKEYVDNFNSSSSFTSSSVTSSWAELGPNTNGLTGVGRITALAFDPIDPVNILYAGAPVGGVWKTTDGGQNWFNLNTDKQFARLGVSSIAIDPFQNLNGFYNIYVSTGETGENYSFSDGIYRSVDGGQTWHTINTNLFDSQTGFYYIPKLLVDPTNNSVMFAATSVGIFKTNNRQSAAPTWTKVYPSSGNEWMRNIEFEPGTNQVLYSSGVNVVKSTLGGNSGTWNSIGTPSSGLDLTGAPDFTNNTSHPFFAGEYIQNINIVISADNTFLYAIFHTRNTPPPWNWQSASKFFFFQYNISNGTWTNKTSVDCGRMPFAISPVNNSLVITGDIHLFSSNNAGANWSFITNCSHVDFHTLKFSPANPNILYTGNDGGVWKYTLDNNGNIINCTELNNGLGVATIYNTSSSVFDPYQMLIGNQDLGVNYHKNSAWKHKITSDGFENVMDFSNIDIMYATTYICSNGCLHRSMPPTSNAQNPSFSGGINVNGPSEPAIWGAPLVMDPLNPKVLYQGRKSLWKTNDATAPSVTWTKISDFQSPPHNASFFQVINELIVAPSNNNYIYASIIPETTPFRLFKTTVGGGSASNWTEITPTPVQSNYPISGIAVSSRDPNHIWITYSGYTANVKVKESPDGGITWVDINAGLPNLPVNCIIYEKGSDDGIYIGTDVGVFYKNRTMSAWQPFMTNLPNTVVSWLDINYTANKIRAGTFGRGLWESNLACPQPTLTLSGNIPSGFFEAEEVTITNAITGSLSDIIVRGANKITVTPANGRVLFASGGKVHLFIHDCDMPGNSFRYTAPIGNVAGKEMGRQIENNYFDKSEISVYPNPTAGYFTVEINNDKKAYIENFSLEIYDVFGKIIYNIHNLKERKINVDLSNYSTGLYLIKVNNEDKIIIKRIIKN